MKDTNIRKIRKSVWMLLISMIALTTIPSCFAATLNIFGNANMDDTIGEADVEYVQGIIDGTKDTTDLSDANDDGTVDQKDIDQINAIIDGNENELTIIDSAGTKITIPMPVERIIVFSTTYGEAVRIVNAEDKVVGVSTAITKDSVYFPKLGLLPAIGSMWTPDLEALISLDPQVVLTSQTNPKGLEDQIPDSIKVVRMDFTDPSTLEMEITELGYILSHKADAEEFVQFYQDQMKNIEDKLEGAEKPPVYMEYGTAYKVAAPGSVLYTLSVAAGGDNVAAELPLDAPDVDAEWLIVKNPEYMVSWCARDKLEDTYTELMGREAIANLSAIKEGNVHAIAYEITTRPACFVGTAYLAKWFHPDLFEDLDPKAIHHEYLTRFQGLDDATSENLGAFVWP